MNLLLLHLDNFTPTKEFKNVNLIGTRIVVSLSFNWNVIEVAEWEEEEGVFHSLFSFVLGAD